MSSSRRSSNGCSGCGPALNRQSNSQSGRFASYSSPYNTYSSAYDSFSSAFASSSSTFSSPSTGFFRSTSPTRVTLCGPVSSSSSSLRFSIDRYRSTSPSRSISASSQRNQVVKRQNTPKRTCMCSPTNHPGSFRCSLHKNTSNNHVPYSSNRLNARRSAMTNSLVRIGTVEGDLVKRALAALIRPSSHQQKRRCAFQPRPSRLSVMSKADDNLCRSVDQVR